MRQLFASQIDAALQMLGDCIAQCPADAWQTPVCNLSFDQAAFHVLVYTDMYLGPDTASFKQQAFHRENAAFFADYEEMEDRKQVNHYEKPALVTYLEFCRAKAREVIAEETNSSLEAAAGFPWLGMSRAEMYAYNLRHIQHHAAQLSLRLRFDHGIDVKWVKRGD